MATIDLSLILVGISGIFFVLGVLTNQSKQNKEASQLSVILAIAAFTDARSLKSAPMLRQIVERYVPIEKGEKSNEKVQQKQNEFADAFNEVWGNGIVATPVSPKLKEQELV